MLKCFTNRQSVFLLSEQSTDDNSLLTEIFIDFTVVPLRSVHGVFFTLLYQSDVTISELDEMRIQLTAYRQSESGVDLCTFVTAEITIVLDEWEPHYPSSGHYRKTKVIVSSLYCQNV